MNAKEIYRSKIIQWSSEIDGSEYLNIDRRIQFLSDYLYCDFEPVSGSFPDFHSRLANWILNLPDEADQKLLLKLVPKIFYVGREEFNCLHLTAFNSIIKTWLIDQTDVNFDSVSYLDSLDEAIDRTWFCPVTDSFRISQFYHLNQISAKHTFRPEWRSLKQFGNTSTIVDYIKQRNVKYLVLLEDFVGSGTQSVSTLKFARELLNSEVANGLNIKILFVPLIVCPTGMDKITSSVVASYRNLYFKPVIRINESEFINEEAVKINSEIFPYVEMVKRTYNVVKGENSSMQLKKIKEFGYKNSGGLVVMFSNTPNNSLPIIFVESNSWSPLFKRHSRD